MAATEVDNNSQDAAEHRKHLLRFAYLCALITWSLLAFGTFIEWFQKGIMFAEIRDGHPYIIDFPLYYAAGKLAHMAMHAPTNIYDIQLQDQTLRALIEPVAPDPPWFIQCPPPVFLLSAALPIVSLAAAWAICCVIGDALFFWCLYLLLKNDLGSKRNFLYIVAGACGSFPFWLCNRMGQLALVTVPSIILFFHLLREKKFFAAGLTTALISFKFQYLPFLGLVGLAVGRFRFVSGAVLSCATVAALSGIFLGWQNVLTYPQTVMHAEYSTNLYSGVNPRDQQNIRALIVRATGAESGITNKMCIGLCLVMAFLFFACWLRGSKKLLAGRTGAPEDSADGGSRGSQSEKILGQQTTGDRRFKFLASATICSMLVFSPHAHTQDYLVLTVPAAWIWLESLKKRETTSSRPRWPRIFVIFLPFLTWPLFIIDKFSPLPPFALLAPVLVAASWVTFRSSRD